MTTPSIRNIVSRYFKNEQVCQVSYAIYLNDGRILRLDVPVSQEYSESSAKDYARPLAEQYVMRLFEIEHRTGRFACCEYYQFRGHRDRCPAFA